MVLRMLERFARTIEVDVSPDEFVYRYGERERRVPTRGYLRKLEGPGGSYEFDEAQKTGQHIAVSLFSSLPVEFRADITEVLGAFILYGIQPLCRGTPIRPILVYQGIDRFETGFAFEYGVFREAGKLIALGDKAVYFKRPDQQA